MIYEFALLELGSFGTNVYIRKDITAKPTRQSFLNELDLLDDEGSIQINIFNKRFYQIKGYLELYEVPFEEVFVIATGIYRDANNRDAIINSIEAHGINQIFVIDEYQELELSFKSFLKGIKNKRSYDVLQCFDIGGGSIEYGHYRDDNLYYKDGVSYGVFYGVKTLLFIPSEKHQVQLEDAFKRMELIIAHEIGKFSRYLEFANENFFGKSIIAGSTAKTIKAYYSKNDYISKEDLDAYIKKQKSKILSNYQNIRHLKRLFDKNQNNTVRLIKATVGGLILKALLELFDISNFEVNPYSLLDGVADDIEDSK